MAKENRLWTSLKFPLMLLVIMWSVQLFQIITTHDLGYMGIYPRNVNGLKGVLFSPFIHGTDISDHNIDKLMPRWQHLISNSPVFFVSTAILMFFYRKVAVRAFIMLFFLCGLSVWIFGRPVYHIGASGVIYGLVSFIFWSGIFRRNVKSIILALVVLFLYSGMLAGILPNQPGISWESHLLGGIMGVFVAYWYKEEIEQDEVQKLPSWETEPQANPEYFLRRDAFDKTKAERAQDNDMGMWS